MFCHMKGCIFQELTSELFQLSTLVMCSICTIVTPESKDVAISMCKPISLPLIKHENLIWIKFLGNSYQIEANLKDPQKYLLHVTD